jgi:predicted Zn finger-like uncharacterized protein
MRLICPNCDAQYDIADDVIPEGGRDVQCSNCTHTWFQTDKPKSVKRTTSILTPSVPRSSATPDEEVSVQPKPPTRKPLDSSIADILRAEASRSHVLPPTGAAKPRVTAPPAIQTQEQRAAETRERISQLTKQSDTPVAATAKTATDDQNTVPSMDEINATLRARSNADDGSGLTEVEKEQAVQRRGFRRGFALVLVLIGLAIMPYVFAGEIVRQSPQTRDFMTQYVQTVDQLRIRLHDVVGQVSTMVEDVMPADVEDATATAPVSGTSSSN